MPHSNLQHFDFKNANRPFFGPVYLDRIANALFKVYCFIIKFLTSFNFMVNNTAIKGDNLTRSLSTFRTRQTEKFMAETLKIARM